MTDQDEVQRVVESMMQTTRDRDRLQMELDKANQTIELFRFENDRLNGHVVQLSSERDHYQCRVAVLTNDLGTIKNIITDAERHARDAAFNSPVARPLGNEEAMAQIAYGKRN